MAHDGCPELGTGGIQVSVLEHSFCGSSQTQDVLILGLQLFLIEIVVSLSDELGILELVLELGDLLILLANLLLEIKDLRNRLLPVEVLLSLPLDLFFHLLVSVFRVFGQDLPFGFTISWITVRPFELLDW